jgi:hypothetical protein
MIHTTSFLFGVGVGVLLAVIAVALLGSYLNGQRKAEEGERLEARRKAEIEARAEEQRRQAEMQTRLQELDILTSWYRTELAEVLSKELTPGRTYAQVQELTATYREKAYAIGMDADVAVRFEEYVSEYLKLFWSCYKLARQMA